MWSAQVRKSFVHSDSRWHKMMIISPSYTLLGIHRGDPLYLTSWTLNRWEIHINSIESTKEIINNDIFRPSCYNITFARWGPRCLQRSRPLLLAWSLVRSSQLSVNGSFNILERQQAVVHAMWPLQVWILHIGKALEDLGSLKFMAHERICLQLAHAHELKHHTFGLLRSIGSSGDTGSKTELKGYWDLMELSLSLPFLQLRFIFARCSVFFNDT